MRSALYGMSRTSETMAKFAAQLEALATRARRKSPAEAGLSHHEGLPGMQERPTLPINGSLVAALTQPNCASRRAAGNVKNIAPAAGAGAASCGGGRLADQEPPETWCRPIISERDRQARCIFAQPGHRKSPARELGSVWSIHRYGLAGEVANPPSQHRAEPLVLIENPSTKKAPPTRG
jgi:hypothetical protein